MKTLKEFVTNYNFKIKKKGLKRYFRRLLITTILETIALAVIPSIIDNRYDTIYIKILVIFIFLITYNFIVGYFIIWKTL